MNRWVPRPHCREGAQRLFCSHLVLHRPAHSHSASFTCLRTLGVGTTLVRKRTGERVLEVGCWRSPAYPRQGTYQEKDLWRDRTSVPSSDVLRIAVRNICLYQSYWRVCPRAPRTPKKGPRRAKESMKAVNGTATGTRETWTRNAWV